MLHTCVTCSDSLKPIALLRYKFSSMFVSGCVYEEILRLMKGPQHLCQAVSISSVFSPCLVVAFALLPVLWDVSEYSPNEARLYI